MLIKIPYWGENLTVSVPSRNVGDIVFPNCVEIKDEKKTVTDALKSPVGFESFNEFLKGSDPVLFVINDATRPTPTARILSFMRKELENKNVKYIIATGIHRAPSQDEYLEIFGELYNDIKASVYSHDSRKEEDNVYIGRTSAGTDVYFDKLINDFKKIVTITSVEPHYFAGYTGGSKSFLPGIAKFSTIEQNHKLALEATAKALAVETNPVRRDIEEAYDLISRDKEVFSIQTVLNKDHSIYYCACGDVRGAFNEACKRAKDVFSVEVKDKSDIVVAVAPYPMDIDLYQSQKAIDNGKLILNENGILIMVSSCRKGLGEETFVNLLSSSKDPDHALSKISNGYKLGYHKSAKVAEMMKWSSVWAYTRLEHELLNSIFIRGFSGMQKAIDSALEEKGDEKIVFLMDASLTVPRVASCLLHKHRFIYGPKRGTEYVNYGDLDDLFAY